MASREPLNQELFERGYSFEFFQAVRIFERLFPERRTVGRDALPNQEVVRFRSRISLDFPSSEIHEVRDAINEQTGDSYTEMLVNFMGLVGVSGVLPTHYTELVLDRIRHRDTAMWWFLDIFTHRLVSMFYQAWSKYRFPVSYERGHDEFTAYLFDIAGLGTQGLKGRMALDDESLLPYAGLISQKPHSQDSLQNVLGDYFGVPAHVDQFVGQWLDLNSADYTLIGVQNFTLGGDTLVGTRVWDQQSRFKVRLGPLRLDKFKAFLPSGSGYKALGSLIRFLVGEEFDFDVQLLLQAQQVPALVLTTRAVLRPMLGWTSWLKTVPFEMPDDQLVLEYAN
jgi:type VI secretion system protein ImpH